MPFAFNAVELYVVTINGKSWARAKEVCKALEYKKGRVRNALKKHVSMENKRHRFELQGGAVTAHALEWAKNSQPDEYYINKEGMYELVFSSQQQKA